MNKLQIFVDMDEVIANLSDTIRLRINKDFDRDFPKGFNKNYWWADYQVEIDGIDRSYFEDLLNEKDLFLNLKPIDGAVEVLHKLNEEGYDIHILTCPQRNESCFIEKIKWIEKYLPFIDIEANFHTTGNKGMLAKENRTLIDDNIKYLQQWLDNGGIPIAFNQGWNQEFEGYRAYDWNEVYEIIKSLNSFIKFSSLCERLDNKKCIEPDVDLNKFRNYMRGCDL